MPGMLSTMVRNSHCCIRYNGDCQVYLRVRCWMEGGIYQGGGEACADQYDEVGLAR